MNAMQRSLLFLITVFGLATSVDAADVVLREHAAPKGPLVRLGDVATVKSEDGLAADHLATTPLMPAPPSGTSQFLRMAELRDMLVARGIDVRSLRFSGADTVTVGAPAGNFDVSDHTEIPPQSTDETAARLTSSIVEYLRSQTGHDLWNVRVDADDDVVSAYQQAGRHAVVSGGKAPWSGRQRFIISGDPGTPSATAYARVERLDMAAFALRAIERGELIRRTDVELRPFAGALPKQAVLSLDSLVGKEAVQSIRGDSLVMANQVRSPLLVQRGDRVSIRVRAAGVSIRTYALAQQDGSLGELVTVQSVESKERYTAIVSGLRELEIMAAGSSAVDVAAAPPAEVR
jgi:flagella basal body P-ring formation protein FlgA